MLIFNTTYHVEEDQEKYFLIWLQEYYLFRCSLRWRTRRAFIIGIRSKV